MNKQKQDIRERIAKINVMIERIELAQQLYEQELGVRNLPVLEESNVINMRDKLHLRRKK